MEAPRALLLLDVETTGLDPRRDELCEVGAILFSVPFRAPICQLSYLLAVLENPAVSINGIEPGLTQLPLHGAQPIALLRAMASAADAFVAHHAAFDQPWIEPLLAGIARPWICTWEGIDWPDLRPNPSLAALALAHGVPVWAAHRALTDCIYLGTPEKRPAATRRTLEKKAGNTQHESSSMLRLPSHSQLVPVDSTTTPLGHKAGSGCRTRQK